VITFNTISLHKYYQRALRGAITAYISLLDPSLIPSHLSSLIESTYSTLTTRKPKTTFTQATAVGPTTTTSTISTTVESDTLETTTTTTTVPVQEDMSHLTTAEQKKLREKLRKQQKKKEKKERGEDETKTHDEQPKEDVTSKESIELAAILAKPPLEEAYRLCGDVVRFPNADAESFAIVFPVYMLRNKLALALRCLSCGLAKAPMHPILTFQLVVFAQYWSTTDTVMGDTTKEVIDSTVETLLHNTSVEQFVEDFVEKASGLSLSHRVAAAKCVYLLHGQTSKARAVAMVTDPTAWEGRGVTIDTVMRAHEVSVLLL
jgi:hypothetical protein